MNRKLSITIPSDGEADDSTAKEMFGSAKRGATGRAALPSATAVKTVRRSASGEKSAARKGRAQRNGHGEGNAYDSLLPTDQRVFDYLDALPRERGSGSVVASIPDIHEACAISLRQVQISTDRLCQAGLIERAGYDFGNPVRKKRGTHFKILHSRKGSKKKQEAAR